MSSVELATAAAMLSAGWRRQRASIDNLAASAQAIVDGLPDPLIAVDRQRRIVRANMAAAALLGPVGAERDLSTALRYPQLLSAVDALLETGADGNFNFSKISDATVDRLVDAMKTETDVAKVSVIGSGMRSHAGVAAKAFKALAERNINIRAITTSEIKFSVLIDAAYTELAVRTLHTLYGLDQA